MLHRWAVLALLAGSACSDVPEPRPGEIRDLPYPRIASYRLATSLDDAATAMLERVPLAIVDADLTTLDPDGADGLAAIQRRNPSLQLLASLPAVAIAHDAIADAKLAAIPPAVWALEPGSTIVGGTSASDTRIRVAEPAAFSVTRSASPYHGASEPTYLLVGDEHVKLVAIEGDELVVERGVRSTATVHPAGSRIAAHVVLGSGTWLVDVTAAAWRDLLVADASARVAAGPWAGVFLDGCLADVGAATASPLDLDRDGVADAAAAAAWQAGFATLVDELRTAVGADVGIAAFAANGDCAVDALDGVLLDGFPVGPATAASSFDAGLGHYLTWTARSVTPLTVAAAYSPAIGLGTVVAGQDEMARTDYAAMRLGLATALLGDGYFAFDNGPLGRSVSWWYDEYDGAGLGTGWLGHPSGSPTRVTGGAYVRMFTRGMVIANPTPTPLMVTVPPGHHKLDGSQDPQHDDGEPVEGMLLVGAHDGYLLAR